MTHFSRITPSNSSVARIKAPPTRCTATTTSGSFLLSAAFFLVCCYSPAPPVVALQLTPLWSAADRRTCSEADTQSVVRRYSPKECARYFLSKGHSSGVLLFYSQEHHCVIVPECAKIELAPAKDPFGLIPAAYAVGDVCEVYETLGSVRLYQQADADFQLLLDSARMSGEANGVADLDAWERRQDEADGAADNGSRGGTARTTTSSQHDQHFLRPTHLKVSRDFCREQCFVLRIVDGVAHLIDSKKPFQSRHQITLTLIQRVLEKYWPSIEEAVPVGQRNIVKQEHDHEDDHDSDPLPLTKYDLELVIDTSDGWNTPACGGPGEVVDPEQQPLPTDCRSFAGLTFMIAKRLPNGAGILYPDFSFHSWPEAECPDSDAKGSHAWERVTRDLLHAAGDAEDAYAQKKPKLFWRGADTSPIRRQVVENLKKFAARDGSTEFLDVEWMAWRRKGEAAEDFGKTSSPLGVDVSDGAMRALRATEEERRAPNNLFGLQDGTSEDEVLRQLYADKARFTQADKQEVVSHLLDRVFPAHHHAQEGGLAVPLQRNFGGQSVPAGECVRVPDWCAYQFLANIPGVSMPLSLKYRLFCNAVILTSHPILFQWFYPLLRHDEHYVFVDPYFASFEAAMRSSPVDVYAEIADNAKFLAKTRLSAAAIDCYWRKLLTKALRYFPLVPREVGLSPSSSMVVVPQAAVFNPRFHLSVPLFLWDPAKAAELYARKEQLKEQFGAILDDPERGQELLAEIFAETRTVLLAHGEGNDLPGSSLTSFGGNQHVRPWFTTALLPWSDVSGKLRMQMAGSGVALDENSLSTEAGGGLPGCVATRANCVGITDQDVGGSRRRGGWVVNGRGIAECRAADSKFSYTVGITVGVHHNTEEPEDRGRECALMNWFYDTGKRAINDVLFPASAAETKAAKNTSDADQISFHHDVLVGQKDADEDEAQTELSARTASTSSSLGTSTGPGSHLLTEKTTITAYQEPLDFLLDDQVDVLIMIPVCAKQRELMQVARSTYLRRTLYFTEIQHVMDVEGPRFVPETEHVFRDEDRETYDVRGANKEKVGKQDNAVRGDVPQELAKQDDEADFAEMNDEQHAAAATPFDRALPSFLATNEQAVTRIARTERLLKRYRHAPAHSLTLSARAAHFPFGVTDASTGSQLVEPRHTFVLRKSRLATKLHYFVICADDPDYNEHDQSRDLLVVDVPHGYIHLSEKMLAAYRKAIKLHPSTKYFIRADVDNAMDVQSILNYLPTIEGGSEHEVLTDHICDYQGDEVIDRFRTFAQHWNSTFLQCGTMCQRNPHCRWFEWGEPETGTGNSHCFTYSHCENVVALPPQLEARRNNIGMLVLGGKMNEELGELWEGLRSEKRRLLESIGDEDVRENQGGGESGEAGGSLQEAASARRSQLLDSVKNSRWLPRGWGDALHEVERKLQTNTKNEEDHPAARPPPRTEADEVFRTIEKQNQNPSTGLPVSAQSRARIHLVHYRMRDKISYTSDQRARRERRRLPFLFGRILFGNRVFCGSLEEEVDLSQRHWENCRFVQDLGGLPVYPPYPEASGYLMTADVVKFMLQDKLPWRGSEWAVEDATQGGIFAGTRLRRINFPYEIMRAQRLVRVSQGG